MRFIDVLRFLGFQLLVLLAFIYGISKFISLFIGKTMCYLKNQNEQFKLFGKVNYSPLSDLFQTHDFRLAFDFQQNGQFDVKNGKEWLSLIDNSKEVKDETTPEITGMIEPDGQIYDKNGFNVGYVGKKDGTPSILGERKWYELFLRCHGYVFMANKQESIVNSEDGQSGESTQPTYTCIGKCIEYGRFKRPQRITTLARGAAFTLLSKLQPLPEQNKEVIRRRYLWHDTILVAALIFSFVFAAIYLFDDSFSLSPVLGKQIGFGITMLILFGLIWVIMRTIKIELSLNGKPIEHTLSLFNRNTGVSGLSIMIILLSALAIFVSLFFAGGDFFALLTVICFSFWWNRKHATAAQWELKDTFDIIDDTDLDIDEPDSFSSTNEGKIEKHYEWKLDANFGNLSGDFSICFDKEQIEEERINNPFRINPFPSTSHYINAKLLLEKGFYYRGYLKKVVRYINAIAKEKNLFDIEKMQFILDFVQIPNIEFIEDEASDEIGNLLEYARTPNETLFDKRGDCDCKAVLAVTLFREAGYPSAYILLPGHAAIGVAMTPDIMNLTPGSASPYLKLAGKNYYFCETTGEHWIIGDYSTNTPDKVEQVIYLDV